LGKRGLLRWQPIANAPEGVPLVVAWLDPEDPEHPERHDFDWLEEGAWYRHSENYEHYLCVAPPGSRGPKERPPYTHFVQLGPVPKREAT
jgi:hypothetical protein